MLNPCIPEPGGHEPHPHALGIALNYRGPERRGGTGLVMRILTLVLDEIDYGVLLLGEGARVLHCNHSARAALDTQHPLYLYGSELRARLAKDSAPLHQALQASLQRGLRRLLTVGEGGQRAGIAIVPLQAPGDADGDSGRSTTLVVLGRREVGGELAVQGFAREHHLSSCEEQVLALLCEGQRPSRIAERHGVKIATVRTQIANIRAKTGADSIRELVQMVALLPPMICALRRQPDSPVAAAYA